MATQHFAINGTGANSVPAPADSSRLAIYIRNYSASVGTMWVAFGQPATPGNAGEMEIPPGSEYAFGNPLTPYGAFTLAAPRKGYPTESVNVITSGGNATGCIVTQ